MNSGQDNKTLLTKILKKIGYATMAAGMASFAAQLID